MWQHIGTLWRFRLNIENNIENTTERIKVLQPGDGHAFLVNIYLINMYKILNESEVSDNTGFRDNILICGDCLNVMRYISNKSIDCIIADLPYG